MPRDRNRPRLGRGLSSLIRDSSELADPPETYQPVASDHAPILTQSPATPPQPRWPQSVPVARIVPNPAQPRRHFDPEALTQLAASIRTHGILQPVLLSRLPDDDDGPKYQLIAGERRLRAAQQAGLTDVACIIRPSDPQESLELALIENIHRADLNAVEKAAAYRDLIDRFGLTQHQVAEQVGETRTSVANYLRILDLCDSVLDMVASGALSFGHARALASLAGRQDAQKSLASKIIDQRLSVRQVEHLVQEFADGKPPAAGADRPARTAKSPWLSDVERQLAETVGTRVAIRPGRAKHTGRIVINYYSLDDFDRIVAALGVHIES